MKSHRATGRPRGRPSIIPWDLGEQILCDLESRMDKANNTVRPDWKGMARRLHVSRSTISREIANLRNSGFIESFSAPIRQGSDILTILYRLKRFA
ncbi:MAG: HTH domain-containing protein [Kiritimatiellae bacterium]|nr:HTH domain-containing protein [Kiritimatiellia bacterium]